MSANTTEAIDNLASVLGTLTDAVVLIALLLIPLGLTVAMFLTRERMLGFPCALFWAIFGGYCYLQSETPWGDIYYYLAFGSLFGMTIFTALAAYGMREKRDTIGEVETEEGEESYIDEGKGKDEDEVDKALEFGSKPSKRTLALRARADRRRQKRE